MKEIWKEIEGFEGNYKVSNLGRVKSLTRTVWNGKVYHVLEGKILKSCLHGQYLGVSLRKEGKTYKRYCHRLMCVAFIENPENKQVCNHVDGDKLNNKLDNLEWSTHSDNNYHAYRTGLSHSGEKHYLAKLTNKDVRDIREGYLSNNRRGFIAETARKYCVTFMAISNIVNYRTWKNLK
mgnify:FL=1